jgi:hypothetical protein
MSKRRNAASVVVEYFQSVPLETAQTVLAICRGIVAKRQPAKLPKPRVVKPPTQRATVA